MNPLVSICIPTYNRPKELREAVLSCQVQNYRPIEVIIGDDSPVAQDLSALLELQAEDFLIDYSRNTPSYGQARNLNSLFDRARGEFLVVLHDDDLLLPDSVKGLVHILEQNPDVTATFGKQYLISHTGELLENDSEELNRVYHRTKEQEGLQDSSMHSAVVAQFPNDGFMIRTSFAKQTRYSEDQAVKDACDLDFGIRLASHGALFYFTNQYTMSYRLTDVSVSSKRYNQQSYRVYENLKVDTALADTRQRFLAKHAFPAVNAYLYEGNKKDAWRIYASASYSLDKRLSPKGFAQLLCFLFPTSLVRKIVGS